MKRVTCSRLTPWGHSAPPTPSPSPAAAGDGGAEWPHGLSREQVTRFINERVTQLSSLQELSTHGVISEIEAKLLPGQPEHVLWPHKVWLRSRIQEARVAWLANRDRAACD